MDDIEAKIKAALDDFWEERAVPSDAGAASSVDDLVGPVESMTAVDVLVALDEIVGFKLPNTVIQAGGYPNKDEFVGKLSKAVMTLVAKGKK